ncbi:hypothetical protein E7Z59_11070 [Robertkochia marina]|uniref:Uncharacterized protein n=1 Tax=Robertkochia marina TaxID=1227945 RepID=A0A4S3LXQ9_9FLAO|nr:hypothetical protein [Robertkochia marina]THD66348.1 hypothetical protein E7Z59_11070 [Robertkochia marina]TRZ44030.1 hypothetical protein D3A96_08880 [Robertkochia marina]
MKRISSVIASFFIVLLLVLAVSSCANARWGTSAGVDVVWGPGGPRVQPNINVGVYNGGRW